MTEHKREKGRKHPPGVVNTGTRATVAVESSKATAPPRLNTAPESPTHPRGWSNKKNAVVLSTSFVLALLVLAVFIPNPTAFQALVFRFVLAAIAAGVGVAISAKLEVKGKIAGFGIRAAGAAAMFVAVFFINPPGLIASKTVESGVGAPAR
jgi:hypothetical protein